MVVPVAGNRVPHPQPGAAPTPARGSYGGGLATAYNDNADRSGYQAKKAAEKLHATQVRMRDRAKAAAAAAKAAAGPMTNAPLHPLTESTFLEGRDSFGLRRGAIVRTFRDASNKYTYIQDPKKRYTFRFLFNPETISFGNQSFAGVVPPQYKNTNDNLNPMFVGQETVSFSLLLDRSQEAYEQGIKTRGTLDDVEMLYKVVNGQLGSGAGFLSLSAVEIHWGPSSQYGQPLPVFPCYITSLDITHTQFTPRMCPMRTAVQVNASRLIGSAAAASSETTRGMTIGSGT